MSKIFKNLLPYWHVMIAILVLLIIQAYCDLSLPQYTSNIIDVGIQNKGIEHIIPEKITADDFEMSQLFMNDDEKKTWKDSFEKDGDNYKCVVTDEDQLNSLDDELMTPLVLAYRMANMSEQQFKDTIKESMKKNPQTAAMADKIDSMTVDQIGQVMKVTLKTFEAKDEKGNKGLYVDMRPLVQQMITSGQMTEDGIKTARENLEKTISTIGTKTISSMGIAYAVSSDKAAGMDVDRIQMKYLWKEGGRMFVMAAVMLIAAICVGYFAARVGASVGKNLRNGVFQKVVSFSSAEMDQFSTASLITRSTNDIQQIQMVTAIMLRMLLYAPILGIGGVYKVIQTKAHMGWIIVLAVLVILGIVTVLVVVAMPKFKAMQKLVDRLNLVSREILTGLSVIRAFGREDREEERFEEANTDLTKTQLFTSRVMTFMMPMMMFVMYGLTLLIVWVAAHKINSGNLEVGAMTAFITYSMQIVMSFLMLTMMSIMLPRAGVAAERIDEVINTKVSIVNKPDAKKIAEIKGLVEFKDVSFRYPGANEDALSHISFKAEPGKTTAIIGSTGSGKSTMINLIPRFYDVTEGSITLDGVNVQDLMLSNLRQEIGFVPQKGVLFSGTVASNLRFGKEDASEKEIEEAAAIAQAKDFIEEKQDKYDSEISQGGTNVSGGQKQRLAIARAITKNPKLFIFDDSFSALDMRTDAALRKALEDKVKESTVIIVAQRISTILNADQIIVLDDGNIVGMGTHSELLTDCEVYQQIAKSQLSAKELGISEGEEETA